MLDQPSAARRICVRLRAVVSGRTAAPGPARAFDEVAAEWLLIRDEVDKNRFGRELPLSEAARRALDQVCPDMGLLFGSHDYRRLLREAAKAAGIDEYRAVRISDYDLAHTRGSPILDR
jgi:integrase